MKKIILLLSIGISMLFAQEIDCRLFGSLNLYKADITATQAYKMQQKGVLLVDIRTKAEYDYLHPKGAILIPAWFNKGGRRVFNKNFITQIKQVMDKDINKSVILICRSGSRTKCAANYLANEGFTGVYNVRRGFAYDWVKANLPVAK